MFPLFKQLPFDDSGVDDSADFLITQLFSTFIRGRRKEVLNIKSECGVRKIIWRNSLKAMARCQIGKLFEYFTVFLLCIVKPKANTETKVTSNVYK